MKNRIKLMKKYFKKKKGPHNEEANTFVNNDLNLAVNRAKALLINEEVSEPFVLRGPNLYNGDIKYRLNQNDKNDKFVVDYNDTLLTVIFLGAKKLHYYQAEIDHTNGNIDEEVSGEIKYENILSTEIEIDNNVSNNLPLLSVVNLVLTLENETEVVFNLRNHYNFDESNYPEVLTETEKYIAKTIKEAINA